MKDGSISEICAPADGSLMEARKRLAEEERGREKEGRKERERKGGRKGEGGREGGREGGLAVYGHCSSFQVVNIIVSVLRWKYWRMVCF